MASKVLLGTLAGGLALAACSHSTTDFKNEAAKFIQSKTTADKLKMSFTAATCDDPATTTVGTEYHCKATGSDGNQYDFTVQITGKSEITVQDVQPV
jgi:hypothetical protein